MPEEGAGELRVYHMRAEAMFESIADGRDNPAIHKEAMPELIDRYRIVGKRVLALGPKSGGQEYWFHAGGNSLFLIDIDELGSVEPMLRTVPRADATDADAVTYVIGDARYVSDWLHAKFDVIFASGFTPDEFHRRAVQVEFRENAGARIEFNKIGTWPPHGAPLSALFEEIVTSGLADDGLMIILSFGSGPDVIRAKNYVPALEDQLERLPRAPRVALPGERARRAFGGRAEERGSSKRPGPASAACRKGAALKDSCAHAVRSHFDQDLPGAGAACRRGC